MLQKQSELDKANIEHEQEVARTKSIWADRLNAEAIKSQALRNCNNAEQQELEQYRQEMQIKRQEVQELDETVGRLRHEASAREAALADNFNARLNSHKAALEREFIDRRGSHEAAMDAKFHRELDATVTEGRNLVKFQQTKIEELERRIDCQEQDVAKRADALHREWAYSHRDGNNPVIIDGVVYQLIRVESSDEDHDMGRSEEEGAASDGEEEGAASDDEEEGVASDDEEEETDPTKCHANNHGQTTSGKRC